MIKNKIFVVCEILLLLSIFVGGCRTKAEKQYEADMEAINTIVSQFNESEDMEEKLDSLKTLIGMQDIYETGDADIESEYDTQISTMRKYFTDYYDSEIKNYTYDCTAEEEETVELLPEAMDGLNDLLALIKSQGEVTCTSKELEQYEDDINNLVDKYESIIEEAEELKKEAEEATATSEEVTEVTTEAPIATTAAPATEAPATEAPVTEAPQTQTNNNEYGIPGPADNLFTSGRAWKSTYFIDENGNNYDYNYFDNYGWIYNEDGSWTGYNVNDL